MKITRIRLHLVNVPERRWWWSDDVYGQPQHQRDAHGIAEVETDAGLTGLTQVEPLGLALGSHNDRSIARSFCLLVFLGIVTPVPHPFDQCDR